MRQRDLLDLMRLLVKPPLFGVGGGAVARQPWQT
jgi:hypothetical protein